MTTLLEQIEELRERLKVVEDALIYRSALVELMDRLSISTILGFSWGDNEELFLIPPFRKVHITMSDASFADNSAGSTATISLRDAAQQPVTPDKAPVWTASDNGAIINLTPSTDGLSATAVPVAVGSSTVTVTLTNNDGTQVIGTSTVTVTPGEAASLSIAWTPIQTQPAQTPTAPTDTTTPPAAPAS